MDEIRADDKLQDTESHGTDQSRDGAVPVTGQADDQHGKQGDGASIGQRRQLDCRTDHRGKGDGHGTENQLFDSKDIFAHKKTSFAFKVVA